MTREKGASRCVRCGACTSVCPVYRITGRESHSARGKHHIIERLAAAERTAAYDDLLSKCLLCGACQEVCARGLETPARVVEARRERSRLTGISFLKYLSCKALANPSLLAGLLSVGASVNRLLAGRLPEESGLRLRLAALAPETVTLPEAGYLDLISSGTPPLRKRSGAEPTCAYFAGCFANHLQPEAGMATDLLVERLCGAPPAVPAEQTCCGMAFLAAGNFREAKRLARKNIVAFEGSSLPILTSCASCYAHLIAYPELFSDEPDWLPRAVDFAARLREFSTWFHTMEAARFNVHFHAAGSRRRVLYHDPCHLRFKHRITAAPRELLARLPGVELLELPSGPQCCGQGGLFHVAHPDLSRRICDRLLADFAQRPAPTVVTTCSGCLLQWQQGLARHGIDSPVMHLAVFMREFLE